MIDVILLIIGFVGGFFTCIGILLFLGRKQLAEVMRESKE